MSTRTRVRTHCPQCGAKSADSLLCHDCTDTLTTDLRLIAPQVNAKPQTHPDGHGHQQTLPWERQRGSWDGIGHELTITLTRQDRHGPNLAAVKTSNAIPLPYSQAASSARLPITAGQARWMLAHIDVVRGWPAHWVERLHEQCAAAMRIISGEYGEPTPPETQTQRMIAVQDAEDSLLKRRDILDALPTVYGLRVSDQRFTNWVARGRLIDHAGRYRLGDVLALARVKVRQKCNVV
jgi:hypothetical protein